MVDAGNRLPLRFEEMKQPEIIAHRGLHVDAHENTLAAFEAALEAGADGIELDVHGTSDGMIVVHHDAAIPSRRGETAHELATASLQNSRKTATEAGFELPLLVDVLDLCRGRAKVYIEVKAPGIELMVARLIRTESCELALHSFDHRVVKRIRDFVPGLETGILTVGRPVEPARLLQDAFATDYWPQADFVDEDLVSAVHEVGGRVVVWTANAPDQWARLTTLGVDGICTDRPDLLRSTLAPSVP